MFEINRYDRLQAQAKKQRNKIDARRVKDDKLKTKKENKIKRLRTEILEIGYKNTVYCENINRKLTDINSLILNEQNRIIADKKANRGD